MFLVDCPSCGRRELRSPRALLNLANTARGIEIAAPCGQCGAVVHTITGRAAGSTAPAVESLAPLAPIAPLRPLGRDAAA